MSKKDFNSFCLLKDDPPLLMKVKEEVPIDTVIGVLEAIDEDIGDNAAVDYAITGISTKIVK